jgi:hypothetical protein
VSRGLKLALAALALAFFSLSGFVCQRVADRGRFAVPFSTYGSGPQGTRALFLLAARLGYSAQRWSQDLAALPANGLLVALGDCESGMARPLSRYEAAELGRWIDQGGTLLVGGARRYLPEKLGVTFAPEPHCDAAWRFVRDPDAGDDDGEDDVPPEAFGPPKTGAHDAGSDAGVPGGDAGVTAASAGGTGAANEGAAREERIAWAIASEAPLLGLEPLPLRRPGTLVIDEGAKAHVILRLPQTEGAAQSARPAGVVVRHGQGRVIALASASALQNRALGIADGGLLFARLLAAYAGRGPVLFDEYHLGVGERRSMMRYLRQAGATPFIVQLAFAVLLVLWRGGARFGGVRDAPEPAPAGIASFVAATGRLFARAGDPAGAAQILVKQALGRVAAFHHLPATPAHKLARALDERGLAQAGGAVRAIGELENRPPRDEGGLVALSRALDDAVARATRTKAD